MHSDTSRKYTVPLAAVIFALCLPLTANVSAQETGLAERGTQTSASPDESAIRYFARQGDEERVAAEIARLSVLYPGWTPPADPLSQTPTIDIALQQLWDLYGEGEYAAVHAGIEKRAKAEPDWQPPQDLIQALQDAELRTELVAASERREYRKVIQIAATRPELLTCQNVDLLWRLSEAFISTGEEERGWQAYAFVLSNCSDAHEREATLQKAITMMSRADILKLFALEQGDEFSKARIELARKAVSDRMNGITARLDPSDLEAIEVNAQQSEEPDDLLLLGYFALANQDARGARDWFKMAFKADPNVDTAIALSAALMQLNRYEDAETTLADFREDNADAEALYIAIVQTVLSFDPPRILTPNALARMSQTVLEMNNAPGAINMGWYAYNLNQISTASSWFEAALSYDPSSEAAAYGLLVASNALKDKNQVARIQQEWGPVSPRIKLFGKRGAPTTPPVPVGPLSLTDIWLGERFIFPEIRRAISNGIILAAQATPAQKRAGRQCADYVPAERLSPGPALNRGWCLMELQRATEAAQAFQRAMKTTNVKAKTNAAYGLTLAYLRLGLVQDAATAAVALPQDDKRTMEIKSSILSTSAVNLYNVGRYEEALEALKIRAEFAPEQNDLILIRAWCYYHLGQRREAQLLFEALSNAGEPAAQSGINALRTSRNNF